MQDEGLKSIQNLEAAFKECDRVVETGDKQAVPSVQQNALTYVGQIEEAMMKGFPFTVPSQYDNLPQLKVSNSTPLKQWFLIVTLDPQENRSYIKLSFFRESLQSECNDVFPLTVYLVQCPELACS